jgi:hypothetical protein
MFDEDDTFLISDWFKHIPQRLPLWRIGVPALGRFPN